MMYEGLYAAFILCLAVPAFGFYPNGINCSDGVDRLEVGCWGYIRCVKGSTRVLECDLGKGEVYDKTNDVCTRVGNGDTDCEMPIHCFGKADGSYPDQAHSCHTFYTCSGNSTRGRQYCPATLVFNPELNLCDYPVNTLPPCGTKEDPVVG